jgi:hypothetical protein
MNNHRPESRVMKKKHTELSLGKKTVALAAIAAIGLGINVTGCAPDDMPPPPDPDQPALPGEPLPEPQHPEQPGTPPETPQ